MSLIFQLLQCFATEERLKGSTVAYVYGIPRKLLNVCSKIAINNYYMVEYSILLVTCVFFKLFFPERNDTKKLIVFIILLFLIDIRIHIKNTC